MFNFFSYVLCCCIFFRLNSTYKEKRMKIKKTTVSFYRGHVKDPDQNGFKIYLYILRVYSVCNIINIFISSSLLFPVATVVYFKESSHEPLKNLF